MMPTPGLLAGAADGPAGLGKRRFGPGNASGVQRSGDQYIIINMNQSQSTDKNI